MGKAASAVRSQREAMERAVRIASRLAGICESLGLRVEGVYVIGSRARGDYTVESDLDLAIVVEGVEGMNALERMELVKEALEPGTDMIVYSLREWAEEGSTWVKEVKREAVKIL